MNDGPRPRRPRAMSWRALFGRALFWRAPGAQIYLLLAMLVGTAAVCGGCAGTAARVCAQAPDVLFAAIDDSLVIDPFLRLAPATQAARRARADDAARAAGREPDALDRQRLLAEAALAAPDDPDHWLALAEARRAAGDRLHTASALEGAAAAVRRLNDPGAPRAARGAT